MVVSTRAHLLEYFAVTHAVGVPVKDVVTSRFSHAGAFGQQSRATSDITRGNLVSGWAGRIGGATGGHIDAVNLAHDWAFT